MRIWLHVLNSAGSKKLVLSPDTDVYHIGLPIISRTELDVVVRLSPFSSLEHCLLDMQALIKAFRNDPDLAVVDQALSPVMQTLYICTGCDFISFFNGFGKATFIATLFEYSRFICGNTEHAPGILTNSDTPGFMAFLRLVGCAHFRKHKAAFLPSFPNPTTLFNSLVIDDQPHTSHHSIWLDTIREKIWTRIQYEDQMIPSYDALLRHWKRSCWVRSVWSQSTSNHITYPPLNDHGWKQPDQNTLSIDWDSESNVSQIRSRVDLICKGCGCKTGCHTVRCKCKKRHQCCGVGCKCSGCTNLPLQATSHPSNTDLETTDSDSSSEDEDDHTEDHTFGSMSVDDIMMEVFGDFDYNEDTNTIN